MDAQNFTMAQNFSKMGVFNRSTPTFAFLDENFQQEQNFLTIF